MKRIKLFIFTALVLFAILQSKAQENKNIVDGPRWRIGLSFQYSSNFKNLKINYPSLGYTGLLGGYTGRGLELFGGYKIHRYISIELGAGVILNSYNRSYDQDVYIIGRFNKFYAQPSVKFIYPIIDRGWGTINLFLGGGVGVNGSGRLYLEERDYSGRYVTYARYDPMIAPFGTLGAELLFTDRSNLVVGFKYQNGSFSANEYKDGYNPSATLRNAPAEIKTISGEGIGLTVGFIQLF